MPGLQAEVWTPLKDSGLDAFVVHVGEGMRFAVRSANDTGLKVPMLLDLDSSLNALWTQTSIGSAPYPLTVIVDKQGIVDTILSGEEITPQQWRDRIEPLLDE